MMMMALQVTDIAQSSLKLTVPVQVSLKFPGLNSLSSFP